MFEPAENQSKSTSLSTSAAPVMTGFEQAVDSFLRGPVSKILAVHAGSISLVRVEGKTVIVAFAGGCVGCPNTHLTLSEIVLHHLRERFGEETIDNVRLPDKS
jgi:Fe-S cluster biogenesis protein NfuA